MPTRYALVSVYDKTGLETIVAALGKQSIQIIGSGGTAETIRKAGYKVQEVSEYTGTPEMPGGLVKTLHPKIHAGILGDWTIPEQRKYLDQQRVHPLDFVIVNLYPFQDTIRSNPTNLSKAVDNIDIGGVTLIRAAAKGALLNNRVVPVTSPQQYDLVRKELLEKNMVGDKLRQQLAKEAFNVTAEYDKAIRDYLVGQLKQ
jgi:phosphoribosylaminoimidazolecarboxamide formyltransferase / IMP cyclohydrolase